MKKAMIKITVVFSLAAFLCILISCNSVGVVKAEDIVSSFKGKMTVTQNDNKIECSICRNNEESACVQMHNEFYNSP